MSLQLTSFSKWYSSRYQVVVYRLALASHTGLRAVFTTEGEVLKIDANETGAAPHFVVDVAWDTEQISLAAVPTFAGSTVAAVGARTLHSVPPSVQMCGELPVGRC